MKRLFARMSGVFSIAFLVFSTHAGGGFASGNQTNTYFIRFGWPGIIGAVLAMILLNWTFKEAIVMYNSRGLKSYKELFETLYHPFDRLEIVFEFFYYIMIIMAIASSISGSASAMYEFFGWGYGISVVAVSSFILVISIFGEKVVRRMGSFMGLIILFTSILIFIVGSIKGDFIHQISLNFYTEGFKNLRLALVSGFIYAGFQCVQIPSVISCSGVLKDEREASMSMKISFIINTVALVLSCVMLLSWSKYYNSVEGGAVIPTLTSTRAIGIGWMSKFYVASLIICLISTGLSIIFGFVSRFENSKKLSRIESIGIRRFGLALFVIILSMFISMAGFTNIIKYGYGYCGYIAISFIVLPFITVGYYKNKKYLQEDFQPKLLLVKIKN